MPEGTSEADIAAVTEVVHTDDDGMVLGEEARLARPSHPRASIVWYSDDLSLVRIADEWRIVHKTLYPHPGS